MVRMSPSQPHRSLKPLQACAAPIGEGDVALVAALRAGNRQAHGVLVERYADDLERVLMRVLGPDRDLDDLLHDVLLAALTSIHTLHEPTKLRSWLVSIAINKARKCLRTRRRWRFIRFLAPSAVPEREASAVPAEVSEALSSTYAALASMPVDDRVFFALRFIARLLSCG